MVKARREEPNRWVQEVKTVSTFPPKDLFTKDAETIARSMASKKVSPKGIGSGIRMIQYFINRAGRNLAAEQKARLENAKRILQAQARAKKGSRALGGGGGRRKSVRDASRRGEIGGRRGR